jgi:glucosamine-6-phosphate deaminase
MALTVGVGTVMDAREVIIVITGAHKALALANCIEQGVNHMYTVSAIQMHPHPMIVCDDDATLELKVKTVKVIRWFDGAKVLVFQEYRVCAGTNLQIESQH